MSGFLKGQQSTVVVVIVLAIILVGAFFLFGNQEEGQVTDEAAEQTEEELKEEEAKKAEEQKKLEQASFPKEYTVVAGDHLWSIAEKFYEDGYKWTLIASENNIQNPDIILPGQELTLPKATVGKNYTVVKGDTLWDISARFYGSGFSWKRIRDANPGKIGTLKNGNPLILPGQVLKIP